MLAGLWNEWRDESTGDVIPSYTMLAINCNAHPLLCLMHRADVGPDKAPMPAEEQDKRTVVPLEKAGWDAWLHGTPGQAASVLPLPPPDLYVHGAADPAQQVDLPLPQ